MDCISVQEQSGRVLKLGPIFCKNSDLASCHSQICGGKVSAEEAVTEAPGEVRVGGDHGAGPQGDPDGRAQEPTDGLKGKLLEINTCSFIVYNSLSYMKPEN